MMIIQLLLVFISLKMVNAKKIVAPAAGCHATCDPNDWVMFFILFVFQKDVILFLLVFSPCCVENKIRRMLAKKMIPAVNSAHKIRLRRITFVADRNLYALIPATQTVTVLFMTRFT